MKAFLISLLAVWVWMPGTVSAETRTVPIYDDKTETVIPMDRIEKSEEEWKRELSPEAYYITRQKGTEPPFSGRYVKNKEHGIYRCVACGAPLYRSEAKYDSGTGWPSFWEPIAEENIVSNDDRSLGMARTELLCARCGAHLGHVFDDGPAPTFKRHCINSGALRFAENDT